MLLRAHQVHFASVRGSVAFDTCVDGVLPEWISCDAESLSHVLLTRVVTCNCRIVLTYIRELDVAFQFF